MSIVQRLSLLRRYYKQYIGRGETRLIIGRLSRLHCNLAFAAVPFLAVEVGFTPSVYTVNEDGVFAVVTVINRNPNLERDITVTIETVSGTATNGMYRYTNTESMIN